METVKSKSESEQRLDMVKKDAETAHTEKSNAIQKAGELQSQLDEERSKKSELEKMFKTLELKLKDTSDKHVQEKEVKSLWVDIVVGKLLYICVMMFSCCFLYLIYIAINAEHFPDAKTNTYSTYVVS
jgi:chromosome condensin MukBEF ATPase and DNA-binding subunit MukB